MTNYDYIPQLLKIQEDNIIINDIRILDKCIEIYAEISPKLTEYGCPNCGSTNNHIHAYYVRKIKHSNFSGKPVILFLKQPRLICMEKECRKTFNIPSPIIDSHKRISNSLLKDINDQISKKVSFKDVAEVNGISDTSLIKNFKIQIHEYRTPLTEVLCIDEFKASTIAGTYAFIIGDPISGTILDILPSRKQDYLIYYFQSISRSEISKVKYIVTDLFEPFRSIVNMEFPNVIHIADRFHWIRLSTDALNKMRIRIMNYHIKEAEKCSPSNRSEHLNYATLLKNNYKLLLKNKYSTDPWYFDQFVKKDKLGNNLTIQDMIELCINKDSYLEEGYCLLQELYRIAKYGNFDNIDSLLSNWINKIFDSTFILPEFQKVALTYKSWKKEIINSFILNPITHQRLTNGFIEGKNNFVKVIKRIGFGYKDFDIFRNRILNANKIIIK